MKTIKVSEAAGPALDWLVARIEGDEPPKAGGKGLDYSTDWAVGGHMTVGILTPLCKPAQAHFQGN